VVSIGVGGGVVLAIGAAAGVGVGVAVGAGTELAVGTAVGVGVGVVIALGRGVGVLSGEVGTEGNPNMCTTMVEVPPWNSPVATATPVSV